MKILIAIGLLILAVNLLVVLMVGFVLVTDWCRARHRRRGATGSGDSGGKTPGQSGGQV